MIDSEVTDQNVFVYMGKIEQRINELLQAYSYIQNKQNKPLYDPRISVNKLIDKSAS